MHNAPTHDTMTDEKSDPANTQLRYNLDAMLQCNVAATKICKLPEKLPQCCE